MQTGVTFGICLNHIIRKEKIKINNYIVTTHSLAKQLLERPDGFLVAKCEDEEFVIGDYERASTCANYDDTTLYWVLNLCKCN